MTSSSLSLKNKWLSQNSKRLYRNQCLWVIRLAINKYAALILAILRWHNHRRFKGSLLKVLTSSCVPSVFYLNHCFINNWLFIDQSFPANTNDTVHAHRCAYSYFTDCIYLHFTPKLPIYPRHPHIRWPWSTIK